MAGASSKVSAGCKIARPLMSTDFREAHRRVIGLYRAYYRYIPQLLKYHDVPKNEKDCKWKLREYFYKNACITDIRVVDMLVIKGFMNLKEITHQWQQKSHIMAHWNPSCEPKRCDFISKFINGEA